MFWFGPGGTADHRPPFQGWVGGVIRSLAPADLVPFLAIGAFAGLRHAEILRLDWAEVDLAGGHIEVKAAKAKTASRRLVPITKNLRQWLTPLHDGFGLFYARSKASPKRSPLVKPKGFASCSPG